MRAENKHRHPEVELHIGAGSPQFFSPAIANGVVYVVSKGGLYAYALDAGTGAMLWSQAGNKGQAYSHCLPFEFT
jgi:outer membrane protein assembly factor BamB